MIPPELDHMEPGPKLGQILARIDLSALSGHDRVVALRACQRMASHYQAKTYQAMASISDLICEQDRGVLELDLSIESAASEIRVALCLTRRAADSELSFASMLHRLPQVGEALAAGRIDLRRAKTIVYGTCHLPEETARLVVERIIDRASRLTSGQLAALLRRLCIEADPQDAMRRYGEAVSERRVIVESTEAGTANLLGLDLPAERTAAVMRRLSQLAQSLKTAGETRTIDQLRADVLLDLLDGNSHRTGTGRGMVDIRVDLATLTELSENPGELAGFGPVIADIARQVTNQQQQAEWRWTVTDAETGMPVHEGTTRRRPNRQIRRRVEAFNPTCVFPGCRMPAANCDLDHRIPWAQGGETATTHLVPLPARPCHPPPRLETPTVARWRPPVDQPSWSHLHHQRPTPITIRRWGRLSAR